MNNPFAVKSPEALTSEEVADLFVDVFADFPKIKDTGHTFIHGARGTGKSMMLRYLEPQVQIAAKKVSELSSLPFFAVHIPIRNAQLSISEWGRLKGASFDALAEHLLTLHVCVRLFNSLSELCGSYCSVEEVRRFYDDDFLWLLEIFGCDIATLKEAPEGANIFQYMERYCEREFVAGRNYLRGLSLKTERVSYDGPLFGFLDFLLPISRKIKSLSFTPDGPMFLMMDDADNLPVGIQKILNTWVSCRTIDSICLKISTQLSYKTYKTVDNNLIESPHDYSEIDIGTIYTSKNDHYFQKIRDIVDKRLRLKGVGALAVEYFPCNDAQEGKIQEIRDELRTQWAEKKGEGKGGFRSSDDVSRYARPEYIRRLGGLSKSRPNYSYAGFRSLVDVSSGIIRWFLEPAARMYSETISKESEGYVVVQIPHKIQNDIIKEWSEEFLIRDFEKFLNTEVTEQSEDKTAISLLAGKLFNLINSLGEFFHYKLVDEDASERRVFSFMIPDKINDDLQEVLSLGVKWGYFQKSTIGSKEGHGRRPLYIFSRRLAPYFNLDPSGYAAYQSITSAVLLLGCYDSKKFLREKIKVETPGGQLPLPV